MRILLVDPVQDGDVERAVWLLKICDVRVGSGATILNDGAPAQGAITLLSTSQGRDAVDLLARFGIRAVVAD